MYKICINETELILVSSNKLEKLSAENKRQMVVPYSGKPKFLLNYIDMLEKSRKLQRVIIHYPDYKKLKTDLKSLFETIKAAGGLVVDENGKVLMIFRRGYWDLPKGKMDLGEGKKQAALREVEEETGVKNLKLIRKLAVTNHAFRTKSPPRKIKKTYWYVMQTENQKLIPQTEEDIQKAEWVDVNEFLKSEKRIYVNIKELLKQYLAEIELKPI